MVAAVKQIVTVRAGGVIHLRSSKLKAGDEAEVIVLVSERENRTTKTAKNGAPRRRPERDHPVARMTKQVRGDIAEANRIRKAIREGRETLIPWNQAKRDMD